MSRSIFLGNEKSIHRVFSRGQTDLLISEAGLCDRVFPGDAELEQNRASFADAEFIFSTWGMPSLDSAAIAEYFPSLRAVFYAAGSVQSFAKPFIDNGIKVFSAWAANAVPVAEYTAAQITLANKGFFSCSDRFKKTSNKVSAEKLAKKYPGNSGCRVGIIGAGMIGSMVCEKLRSLDIEILVYDPFMSDEKRERLGVTRASLEELFSECQTVSNHLANNPQTVGMLGYELFASMKNNAVFINTGRGAQIDEDGMIRTLREREDIYALLDVTFPEPPEAGSELYTLPNVILTPHIAGSLGNEVHRMAEYMTDEFRRFTAGEPTRWEVSEKMLATMA